MKCSSRGIRIFLAVLSLAVVCGIAVASPVEPTPSTQLRALRPDYIRSWYIYCDQETNGILDPGDRMVNVMDNWWSTVSSGTQHTSVKNGNRVNTAPMNHAVTDNAENNYWLPRANRELHFYMSYSQMDNNSIANFQSWVDPAEFPGYANFMAERHGDADGWHLGWVINDYTLAEDKGPSLGNFDMDIFVHNGRANTGEWISNPQVSSSNHISDLCMDHAGNRVTPKWNDATMAYDAAANANYIAYYQNTVNPAFSGSDITTIANSMEIHERNPYGTGPNVYNGYLDPKTPQWVLDNLVDHAGNPYTYDDAFTQRSELFQDESIGGVIAGLAGLTNYDPQLNNWGDQQVVRIDLGQDALSQLDRVVMYDFGYAPGSGQITPIEIVFGVVNYNGLFRLWYDFDGDSFFDVEELMPDNRIYIAQVDIAPEPLSLAVLGLGGLALALKNRRSRRVK